MENNPLDLTDSFDEAVLRDLLAFDPLLDSGYCVPPSPVLSEATSTSTALPRRRKVLKRSVRRAKLRPCKSKVLDVKEVELDPCDFLELGKQPNSTLARDTVNEIKDRLKAIEEGISQAKQTLQTFISRKAGVHK